ncbi:hypothetical protein ACMHYB_25650 [Sorangium sp. So ce1128]
MVPRATLEAGFRLTLHGLDSETLHGQHLRKLKTEAKRVMSTCPSGPARGGGGPRRRSVGG